MDFIIGLLIIVIAFSFIKKIGKLVFSILLLIGIFMLVKEMLGIDLISMAMNLLN